MKEHDLDHLIASGGYTIEREDFFEESTLNNDLWLASYLPQWSSRARASARYQLSDGQLHLRIEPDQPAWCPEFDGQNRVSSVQTGVFAGPSGSSFGQSHFTAGLVVREEQTPVALYTPLYGLFEIRARAVIPPDYMVAFWMIGFEEEPTHSAEICVCEIFGHNIERDRTGVGMGVHPFGDPTIRDDYSTQWLPIDPSEFHLYSVEWTAEQVTFFVDEKRMKVVQQSPGYPMQFMIGIYHLPQVGAQELHWSENEFAIDFFRGYRR